MKLLLRVLSLPVLLVFAYPLAHAGVAASQAAGMRIPTVAPPGFGPGIDGLPFPRTGDAKAWTAWREQVATLRKAQVLDHKQDSGTARVSGSGVIQTLVGTAPFQTPTTALQAGLGEGQGLAEDAAGDLFVSTGDLGTVLKINAAGSVSVYAGQPLPAGSASASGDGGAATAARVPDPVGLALDASGNLYIADLESSTVRMVAAATGIISTVAGTPGRSGDSGDGGPATSALLYRPSSVALDGNGHLFIADADYVREVNLTTGVISTFAGAFAQGPCELSATQTCPATDLSVDLAGPGILAVNGNVLDIVIEDVFQQTFLYGLIVSVNLDTGVATILAGGSSGAGTLSGNSAIGADIDPTAIAVDGSGNLDIADGLGLVRQLLPNGTSLATIAGTSQQGFSGDGGAATSADLLNPQVLAVTPTGNLLIADTDRIRSINASGIITTIAGDGFGNFFGDGGTPENAGLDIPTDIAVDAQGSVYIADEYDQVVRRVDHATGIITTVAGNGSDAYQALGPTGGTGDGGPATQAEIGYITGVAVDNSNHLLIAEGSGIRSVDLGTGVISTLNSGQYYGPLAFDGNQTLYATINYQVVAINTQTGIRTAVTAGAGQTGGDGGLASKAYAFAYGLALDGKGNLFIADGLDSNIRAVNLSTGIIETIAGSLNGHTGYSGDGGNAANALMYDPIGIRCDGAGHLLVADTGNDAIRQIDLTTNIITTIAGGLGGGFTGDAGAPAAATLYFPAAVAFDATGNMYIADLGNDRVRRVVVGSTILSGSLAASLTNLPPGASVMVAATFDGQFFGVAPTGTVTFLDGTTPVGTGTLVAGTSGAYVATVNLSSLTLGMHSITAQYAGDANYAASTAPALTLTVSPSILTSMLSASSTSVATGASVTFTATYMGAASGLAPTGTVTFLDGTTSLGTGTLAAGTSGAYVATLTNSSLAAGAHSITAQYAGDTNYAANTSAAVTVTVTAPIVPTFNLTSNVDSVSFVQGTSGTAVLTVTPGNAFNQAVTFGCQSLALAGTTPGGVNAVSCSFSPATVTPSGTTPVTTTVTFSAPAGSALLAFPLKRPSDREFGRRWSWGGGALACLLMLGLPGARRRSRGLWIALAGCVLLAGSGLGCGSNSGPTKPQSGSYPQRITATAGTGANQTSSDLVFYVTVTK